MDGGRRLAEPVTDGADARPAAGPAPGSPLVRVWALLSFIGFRPARMLRRWTDRWSVFVRRAWVPHGFGTVAVISLVVASGIFGVVRGGHMQMLVSELRDTRDALANAVGFRITSIALAGQRHLTRDDILKIAGVTGRTSLLFLDASEARERLKADPWIADATVLKLYPGRLHIAVTERDAFALWQRDGKVEVIADDGTVVGPYTGAPFTALPLVVGVGAATRAKDFLALLDRYPAIRSRLHAAVLVAERRWNVMLKNGIDIRLPEADTAVALDTLLKFDQDKKLLTRDLAAIDLRLPDRITVQLSDEAAAAARAEALKAKSPKKKGGAA
jgi:cell division protein FtsQ